MHKRTPIQPFDPVVIAYGEIVAITQTQLSGKAPRLRRSATR
jgi:hypothetical protein